MLSLRSDQGWHADYLHINNDTPGTDDGLGSERYAFAPGLQSGERVVAGQFLAWVGDSGNAEETGPHLHFELAGPQGLVNPARSLRAAQRLSAARVNLPEPTLLPAPGELRLDGALRTFDPGRRVVAVDLIARTRPGKAPAAITAPEQTWVKLGGVVPTGPGPDPAEGGSLLRGLRVTAFVQPGVRGAAASARRLVLRDPVPVGEPAGVRVTGEPEGAMRGGGSAPAGRWLFQDRLDPRWKWERHPQSSLFLCPKPALGSHSLALLLSPQGGYVQLNFPAVPLNGKRFLVLQSLEEGERPNPDEEVTAVLRYEPVGAGGMPASDLPLVAESTPSGWRTIRIGVEPLGVGGLLGLRVTNPSLRERTLYLDNLRLE